MRSKRERKNKDRNSLKRKSKEAHAFDYAIDEEDASKDELQADLAVDGDLDTNTKVLTAKKPSKNDGAVGLSPAPKRISKKEQRKLRQIANEKALKIQREQVMQSLGKSALSETDLGLLRSSAAIGQRETKRQRVEREFKQQKAGIQAGDESALQRRRQVKHASEFPTPKPTQRQPKDAPNLDDKDADSSENESDHSASSGSYGEARKDESNVQNLDIQTARMLAQQARTKLGLHHEDDTENTTVRGGATISGPSGKQRLVQFHRPDEIQKIRTELPILGMEQEIMEAVLENDVVVLSGETGCGKTTQVPQFLMEAGYGCKEYPDRSGMIGVTQPRRVAATASAQRVAVELASPLGSLVGYQIRYDQKSGKDTALKFMTDGILMREAQADFLLRKFSCIIIDEAHERSLNTDLLIGMLSRIVPLRRAMAAKGKATPLKLVIMSATLRTEDFVANRALFPSQPPLVHVPARQFPVVVHFSKKTELHDYCGVACKKAMQIHKQLPPGGILVFMTGQREVEFLCSLLRSSGKRQRGPPADSRGESEGAGASLGGTEFDDDVAEATGNDKAEIDADFQDMGQQSKDDYDEAEAVSDEEETFLVGGGGFSPEELAAAEARFTQQLSASQAGQDGQEKRAPAEGREADSNDPPATAPATAPGTGPSSAKIEATTEAPLHVLPLYALLSTAAQARVFSTVPAGHRLIVVATNVAETSLTIPGIRYVVDAGRAKQKLLEENSGMAKYEVGWISKASAEQRAGRAGRTGPGHCYRLFSSAVYNDQFEQHTAPEIQNTALEGVILVMKAMGIDKVINFPYPTPPSKQGLGKALQCLRAIGAISSEDEAMTHIGKEMATLPISPRHAKLIIQILREKRSAKEAVSYAVALAAAISVDSPFVHIDNIKAEDGQSAEQERSVARAAHLRLRNRQSDALSAMNALLAYEAATNKSNFCQTQHLAPKNLAEASALFHQLKRIVTNTYPEARFLPPELHCPALVQLLLRKALTAGWIDQVAKRTRSRRHVAEDSGSGKRRAVRYECATLQEEVFLHPNSALYKAAPEFVVSQELVRSSKRPYMTGVTEIDANLLLKSQSPLLEVSEPLAEPGPSYSAKQDCVMAWHDASFGKHAWSLPRLQKLHPDPDVRHRVFAAALLAGKVLPSLKEFQSVLVAPAEAIARESSQGIPRVGSLVNALRTLKIDSKSSLQKVWRKNTTALRLELLAFISKPQRPMFSAKWSLITAASE